MGMSKILVCQHVPYEILGTLNPLFKTKGFRIHYVNFGRHPDAQPGLNGYNGLVVLGGPMNVDQECICPHLKTEVALIQDAIQRKMPILGICLGAQLIAKALGAAVKKNKEKEIGWYDLKLTAAGSKDPILKHFKKTEKIFQWHGDTFEIPKSAVKLASSPSCANQAFRYHDNVYAFQFHMEVDERLIERWLKVPHHLQEMKALEGKIDPEQIAKETPIHIDRLKHLSNQTFGEFIKLLSLRVKKKARILPSK